MKKISILWLFAMIVFVSSCKEDSLTPPAVPPHSYPSDVTTKTVSVNGVSFAFAEIKGGTFKMGSSDGQSAVDFYIRNEDSYTYLAFDGGSLGTVSTKEACYATETFTPSIYNIKVEKVPATFALQTDIKCNASGDFVLTSSPSDLQIYKVIFRTRPKKGDPTKGEDPTKYLPADGVKTFDTDSAALAVGSISSGDEILIVGNSGTDAFAMTNEAVTGGLKGRIVEVKTNPLMKEYILLNAITPDRSALITENSKITWTISTGAITPVEAKRFTNEDQHFETVQNFHMGTKEVTQAQFEAITGKNPSLRIGADLPVDNVTYLDVQDFINKLNIAAAAHGTFSLPSEIQWEYACRAGSQTPFYTGGCLQSIDANYYWFLPYGDCGKDPGITVNNGPMAIQAGGTYAPNAYGLYDMHGNVSEWCNNWLGNMHPNRDFSKYSEGIPFIEGVIDPATGKTVRATGEGYNHRAIRGGNWNVGAEFCRSALRLGQTPDKVTNFEGAIGFRLVFKPL